jgi:transcriptional regulator with XRE-family HTH domain
MSSADNALPEIAQRIAGLRKALGLTQEHFAARVGVGRIAVLYWERGKSPPSPDAYIRLAKLAKDVDTPTAAWLLNQVGLDGDTVRAVLPEFESQARRLSERLRQATVCIPFELIAVPLLRTLGSNLNPGADPSQIEGWLPVQSALVRNPSATCCMRSPSEMSAMDGENLVMIDSTILDLPLLENKIIIVLHKPTKQTYMGYLYNYPFGTQRIFALSESRQKFISFPNAISIKATHNTEDRQPFTLRSPGPYLPFVPPREWKVLGRVVCSISWEAGLSLLGPE